MFEITNSLYSMTISPFSSHSTQEGVMSIFGRRLSVRAIAGDCETSFEFIKAIPQNIIKFCAHRYADVRMFFRAIASISVADSEISKNRIEQIVLFRNLVAGPVIASDHPRNLINVQRDFENLPEGTRALFFYVDSEYVRRFDPANDNEFQKISEEIVRECDVAIYYQQHLVPLIRNVFFNRFSESLGRRAESSGNSESSRSPNEGNTTPVIGFAPSHANDDPAVAGHRSTTEAFFNINGVTLHIPGACLYWHRPIPVELIQPRDSLEEMLIQPRDSLEEIEAQRQNLIAFLQEDLPEEVRRKATEIRQLLVQFENLSHPPSIPSYFTDAISQDIMVVPVFDASHPQVQNRNGRHTLDYISFEQHRIGANNGRVFQCPICRHPGGGRQNSIRLENVLIDTELQDQILQFLRDAVASSAGTT